MFARHVDDSLPRYCDGELSAADRQRVDAHLDSCARCRTTLEEIRFSATVVRQLKLVSAPPSVWNGIDEALSATCGRRRGADGWRWAMACVAVLALAGGLYWSIRERAPRPWQVARAGAGGAERMAAGEWVETGRGSGARIVVGRLGTVDAAPQTRVRLGQVSPSEYRLWLDRGMISARSRRRPACSSSTRRPAPSSILGCAYTVTVADDGAGELRMTKGWASLEWNGRESLVPAGASCRTKAGAGPGTPVPRRRSRGAQASGARFRRTNRSIACDRGHPRRSAGARHADAVASALARQHLGSESSLRTDGAVRDATARRDARSDSGA